MWTSLRTAVSGMLAQQRALDVAADNLTKMQIPGSKSQRISFVEMAPELTYLGVPDGEGNVVIDARETGKGVRTTATLQDLGQGSFFATGNPLDIAIDGDALIEVTLPNGQTGFTHGGTLRVDNSGRLMTASGAELSPPIVVPLETESMEINADGSVVAISQTGARELVGRMKLVRFVNPEGLQQIGENLLVATVASGEPIEGQAGEPGIGTVVSGILESSNIDPREEYLRIVQAQRAYELNVRALRTLDEMVQDAYNLRRS